MSKIRLDIPHSLSKDQAKQRMEKLLTYWATKYGVATSWSGDAAKLSGTVLGLSLAADLKVHDKKVDGEATDPGFLFRERAKKYLLEKFAHYLNPRNPIDELE
jgi:putative polyhydroxyalkanoic acid system protein